MEQNFVEKYERQIIGVLVVINIIYFGAMLTGNLPSGDGSMETRQEQGI